MPPLSFYKDSVCKKLCHPQVFTKTLFVKSYAPNRFLQGFGLLKTMPPIPDTPLVYSREDEIDTLGPVLDQGNALDEFV